MTMKEHLEEQLANLDRRLSVNFYTDEPTLDIALRIKRLIETLIHGEPKTPMPPRHHP